MSETLDPRMKSLVERISEIADREGIHGLAFQHHSLCLRRAFFHLHRVDYAHLDERMARGLVLHETARPRDRSIVGLQGLAADRIDWKNRIVIEAKGGAGAVEAVSRQTAFYAAILMAATGVAWSAMTDLITSKRMRKVAIDHQVMEVILADLTAIIGIKNSDDVPDAKKKPICSACSYRYLCGYD